MTLAELGSVLAVAVTFYGIFAQRRKVASESVTLDAQAEKLRDEITRSVLATARQEIDRHTARIVALELELGRAQELIGQLQTMVRERDQAIANLQFSVQERDAVIDGLQTQITALKRGQSGGGVMR